jgi:hypothetical protein
VGRACTEGCIGSFVGVDPPVHGRSKNIRAWVSICYLIIHTWVCPKGEKMHALYVRLLSKQLRMGASLCGRQTHCDVRLCT